METKEMNKENIKTLVKLGIDVDDIANLYVSITEKGHDISKEEYIKNLTDKLKFFQKRNKGINEETLETDEAIYKEDVLEMLKHNKKMIEIDTEKKIKPICEKLDGYYFMNQNYTNKLIKSNPNIFNINKIDLEIYSVILSQFAIKSKGEIVNLYEYIIKQESDFLNENVQKVYQRIMFIKDSKQSKLLNRQNLISIRENDFIYENQKINEKNLHEKYKLPKYKGEEIIEYKDKILKNFE